MQSALAPALAPIPAPEPVPDLISFQDVGKVFAHPRQRSVQALEGINLNVPERSFVTIVGPSGCGKSTLLKALGGLVPVTAGQILFKGREVQGINTSIGYVPQDSKLFFWLTVDGNISFPLRLRGIPKDRSAELKQHYLKLFGLEGFEHHYPHQLSGGMSKRVSIIRTIIYGPDVILMDEPFGPLDAQTRMVLQNELLKLWDMERKTIVFVTHDLVEAIALSDHVVVMSKRPGRIKGVVSVPIPRPRNVFAIFEHAAFKECYDQIWDLFRDEI